MAHEARQGDGQLPAYFPPLDGLRFVCATAVIVCHAFARYPWPGIFPNLGAWGVNVFFSLSGFLITKLLLDEVGARGRADLYNFYVRRTLRIWPVYYAAVAVGFGLLAVAPGVTMRLVGGEVSEETFRKTLPEYLAFLANWSHAKVPTPLEVLWSVSVEEQFYLLFPITFALSSRRWPALRPILLGLLAVWVVRVTLVARSSGEVSIWGNTFARGDNLLLGALLAQLAHAAPRRVSRLFRTWSAGWEALAVLASVTFLLWNTYGMRSPLAWWAYYLWSGLGTALLVGAVGFGDGPLARALGRPAPIALGRITYATYCFHVYAVAAAWVLVNRLGVSVVWGAPLRAVIAIPLAYLLGYACKITFEERILRLKGRLQRVPAGVAAKARPETQ